ncbi:MAG: Hpt domain-containing protein [Candidatus Wallbacteria bacterium]|nr:Hpt domain-containing protein [Candidatus Wallbacteria bacterium]
MTASPEDLKARICDFATLVKEGSFGGRAFVEAFANAGVVEDAEQSYFPEFLDDFRTETSSILEKIRATVHTLVAGTPVESAQIAEAFRFCHMLKGSAATMGFNRLSYLAHGLERAFEELKENRLPTTPDLVQMFQQAFSLVEEVILGIANAK